MKSAAASTEQATKSPAPPGPPRLGRGLVLGCAAAILGCVIWAFWPPRLPPSAHRPMPIAPEPAKAEPPPRPLAALDLAAFHAPLWVAPPPPPAPPAPPPPPPPLKLQLLAIVHAGSSYRASLYDPDSDKVLEIGPGDTIAGRSIESVSASEVKIKDGGLVRTLSLREGGPP